jgi:hypothetical protein
MDVLSIWSKPVLVAKLCSKSSKVQERIDLNLKLLRNHDLREHRILPALNNKESAEWIFIYELLKPFPQSMSQDALCRATKDLFSFGSFAVLIDCFMEISNLRILD